MSDQVAKVDSKSPYQLDLPQTTQACKVLLTQIKKQDANASKPNLLATDGGDDEEPTEVDEAPVWMVVNTKKHIVDQKRLKPNKIQIPNSFNTSATSTICLITADPASAFRDAIDQPSFPAELRTRITRVIALSKLKTDFKQFEARRKLFGEHDIFLADDRVVTFLPKMLGKVFYKGGVKRPVPISIAAQKEREDGKRVKVDPAQLKKGAGVEGGRGFATPIAIAKEIESALSSALVHLAPGTTTSVRVGRAGMTPDEVSQNIEAVVNKLVEKFVTKGWRNIKAIHLKGTSTVALPIWHANELWVDDEDVHEEKKAFGKKLKPLEAAAEAKKLTDGTDAGESPGQKKRKRTAGSAVKTEGKDADKHAAKKVKQDKLAEELATRKDKLKKQKEAAMAQVTEVA